MWHLSFSIIFAKKYNPLNFNIMNNLKKILLTCITFVLIFTSCSNDDDGASTLPGDNWLSDPFLAAQNEIEMTARDLFLSAKNLNADKLISYHHYGPKFTDFKNEGPRGNSESNEAGERGFVGAISDFEYDLNDLKINVFGDVAIMTFHADFRPTIDGNSDTNY
jgi:hypothetical protein